MEDEMMMHQNIDEAIIIFMPAAPIDHARASIASISRLIRSSRMSHGVDAYEFHEQNDRDRAQQRGARRRPVQRWSRPEEVCLLVGWRR